MGAKMQTVTKCRAVHLRFDLGQNAWIGMADVGHHRPRRPVNIAFAVFVDQVNPVAVVQKGARIAGLVEKVRGIVVHFAPSRGLRRNSRVQGGTGVFSSTAGGIIRSDINPCMTECIAQIDIRYL